MKIELILTGGTIGSTYNENNIIDIDTVMASNKLITNLFELKPEYKGKIEFNISRPIDLLSENLNFDHWNALIEHLKSIDMSISHGIIITHGTDTLAFTANLMSLLFDGIDVPVFLVSSAKPLTNENANGYDNFNKAVDLIHECVVPSVYVPYKNRNEEMNIHGANRIVQSADLSPDFESAHHKLNVIEKIRNELGGGSTPLLTRIEKIKGNILSISPYPGLNYNDFDLDSVDAVLHRTYHSSTVSAGISEDEHSIFSLKNRCDEKNIPLYITPVLSGTEQTYASTSEIIKRGIVPLFDMTFEMSYIYLVLKHSL